MGMFEYILICAIILVFAWWFSLPLYKALVGLVPPSPEEQRARWHAKWLAHAENVSRALRMRLLRDGYDKVECSVDEGLRSVKYRVMRGRLGYRGSLDPLIVDKSYIGEYVDDLAYDIECAMRRAKLAREQKSA